MLRNEIRLVYRARQEFRTYTSAQKQTLLTLRVLIARLELIEEYMQMQIATSFPRAGHLHSYQSNIYIQHFVTSPLDLSPHTSFSIPAPIDPAYSSRAPSLPSQGSSPTLPLISSHSL
jgi:hypothetical protein